MPDIAEISKNVMVEETKEGLNIEIVDQDGRSMFADGTKEPNERTRRLIEKMAPALKAMPYRVSITGHTAASKVPGQPGYGAWELSADRANAVRQILAREGLPSGHIYMVAGKADTDPLFPDNPSMSPNRRVTITLMREAPPIPADFTP
jgi:chemotaxis protein MotB